MQNKGIGVPPSQKFEGTEGELARDLGEPEAWQRAVEQFPQIVPRNFAVLDLGEPEIDTGSLKSLVFFGQVLRVPRVPPFPNIKSP
jgi:hypothetical protein